MGLELEVLIQKTYSHIRMHSYQAHPIHPVTSFKIEDIRPGAEKWGVNVKVDNLMKNPRFRLPVTCE